MSTFATSIAASRRLAILRFVHECGGAANESVIGTALKTGLGFRGPALGDGTAADLAFLADRGLLRTSAFAGASGSVTTAEITKLGVRYLDREVGPIEGVKLPEIGV